MSVALTMAIVVGELVITLMVIMVVVVMIVIVMVVLTCKHCIQNTVDKRFEIYGSR